MSTRIVELFGYDPYDQTSAAKHSRQSLTCPFIGGPCLKKLSDGAVSGVCSLKPATSDPVICCPYRLYGNNYSILSDVARQAFGGKISLVPAGHVRTTNVARGSKKVAVFGKGWGKELRLPNRGRSGAYFVDWVLAELDQHNQLKEFIAVEVQSIDTTGNYQAERLAAMNDEEFSRSSSAGFNWENVNKRILPQLIYKGHVLRQEELCRQGLFFVCPRPVYNKVRERLGDGLRKYQPQPGSLTFIWYDLDAVATPGKIRPLHKIDSFTTTVDQVALAFTAPSNLPPAGVYEKAIRSEI
ncbi:MAG: NotI family restriction endonuclease [Dokdonella sp.]